MQIERHILCAKAIGLAVLLSVILPALLWILDLGTSIGASFMIAAQVRHQAMAAKYTKLVSIECQTMAKLSED